MQALKTIKETELNFTDTVNSEKLFSKYSSFGATHKNIFNENKHIIKSFALFAYDAGSWLFRGRNEKCQGNDIGEGDEEREEIWWWLPAYVFAASSLRIIKSDVHSRSYLMKGSEIFHRWWKVENLAKFIKLKTLNFH